MFTLTMLLAAQANAGTVALEPPSDREVIRALPVIRSVPLVFEQHRDNLVIVKERTADLKVTMTLLRGARVTVAVQAWQCTAYYTKTIESVFLFPLKLSGEQVRIVFLNRAIVE